MTQDRAQERPPPQPDDRPAVSRLADANLPDAELGAVPEPPSHRPDALRSLEKAMRRARYDDAERVGATSDLRVARIGRLELLAEALQPLVAQIPEDVDLFDVGLMRGANPRLFLDMIGFVEMGRDARTYRLIQDTRHGRRLIAETDSIDRMVDAATDYVARRLLERDKALAADDGQIRDVPRDVRAREDATGPRPARAALRNTPAASRDRGTRRPSRLGGVFGAVFSMLIYFLGAISFFAILFYALYVAWTHLHG